MLKGIMLGEIFRVQDAVKTPVRPLRPYKTFFLPGRKEAHQSEGENDLRAFQYVTQRRPETTLYRANGTGGGVILVAGSDVAETLFVDAATHFNSRENPQKQTLAEPFWKDQMQPAELTALLAAK